MAGVVGQDGMGGVVGQDGSGGVVGGVGGGGVERHSITGSFFFLDAHECLASGPIFCVKKFSADMQLSISK